MLIESGGIAIGVAETAGIATIEVLSGGLASAVTLAGADPGLRANEFIYGVSIDTTLDYNSVAEVFSGGLASTTTVNSGAFELVNGGTCSDTLVNAGGADLVWADGVTSNTKVAGGVQVVEGVATGLMSGMAVSTTVENRRSDRLRRSELHDRRQRLRGCLVRGSF